VAAGGSAMAAPGDGAGEPPVVAVPGEVRMLDGGVPWVRTEAELAREWARLTARLVAVTGGRGRAVAEMDGAERALLGVRAAARWTLGETACAPMSRDRVLVTGASIRGELAEAERVMEERGSRWPYATGVLYWLLWITGATPEMVHPGWRDQPA
jgi:hypothetical protein